MKNLKVRFTLKSENVKVGPMPVSITDSRSCPPSCPLNGHGCYAQQGPLSWIWKKTRSAGLTWSAFCRAVAALPAGQLWRHNQAGDLPGIGEEIDGAMLGKLVKANHGRRGFTYTHKPPIKRNIAAIRAANSGGFTVNLSANNLEHADQLKQTGLPVAVVLPHVSLARERSGPRALRKLMPHGFETPMERGARRLARRLEKNRC